MSAGDLSPSNDPIRRAARLVIAARDAWYDDESDDADANARHFAALLSAAAVLKAEVQRAEEGR